MRRNWALYNDIDPFVCEWTRQLMKTGQIAPGVVDDRSISEIQPEELNEFCQVHLFSGIAVWSFALRAAGWPDDRRVWTASCPCQPWSAAGKRGGLSDERHLWPEVYRLADKCRPDTLFGEQVASKDGLAWFDLVSTDMERAGYAIGAVDTCAAGVGAPHIRQRLYFVADSARKQHDGSRTTGQTGRSQHSDSSELGNSDNSGSQGWVVGRKCPDQLSIGTPGLVNELVHTESLRQQGGSVRTEGRFPENGTPLASLTGGFWRESDWIYCRDEKYRPVETGTFPLAHGITNRVGKLRGYGNALVAPVATAFIESFLEVERESA